MADARRGREVSWERVGRWILAVGVGALVGVPLVRLLILVGVEGGPALGVLAGQQRTLSAALGTLLTAGAAVMLSLIGGTLAALVTERTSVPGRRWLRLGLVMPLLVPPFVSAIGWERAYGPSGLLDDLIGISWPGLFGPLGVIVVVSVHAMPLAYLVIMAALASGIEPDLERAARASGASGLAAFRAVTLPLLRPALIGAAGIVFVNAANAFGVPAVLGIPAGFETVTTRIYRDVAFSADPTAFTRALVMATGLVAVTLVIVGAVDSFARSGERAARTGRPAGAVTLDVRSRHRRRTPALAVWLYLALTGAVPLACLTLTALTRAVGVAPVPAEWTLANFEAVLTTGRAIPALLNSTGLAVAAATVAVILGALLAGLARGGTGHRLGTIVTLAFAIPGSALAIAVLLAYGPWLRDTLFIILIAYLAKLWALGHRPIAGSVDALAPDLLHASRASGGGRVATFLTVAFPLLRSAFLGAWLLVFLFAFHELTMSSLLYGPGSETLAVVILNLQQLGDATLTSALAVLLTALVLVAAIPVLLVGRASGTLLRSE